MKKRMKLSILGVILFIFYIIFHFSDYNIKNSKVEAEQYINEFYDKNDDSSLSAINDFLNIEIVEWLQLGESDTWFAHVLFDNKLYGFAIFKEGWNQRLQLESVRAEGAINYREFETNKGFYGVVFGRNPTLNIDQIKVITANKQYQFINDVDTIKTFVKIEKLPEYYTMDTKSTPANFFVYDKEGYIISEGIY
ncbi:hypothetical protein ACIQ2D_08005 [Lysinibacillus sp. NPDC097287]|uniref:hypothetical protein n=1 Tax=Lysinibacillus sp. NPDC097287 TaxID=3364144 RepID=UPI0037FB508D